MPFVENYRDYQIFTAIGVGEMRPAFSALRVRRPDSSMLSAQPFPSLMAAHEAIDADLESEDEESESVQFAVGQGIKTTKTVSAVGVKPDNGATVKGVIPEGTVGEVIEVLTEGQFVDVTLELDAVYKGCRWRFPTDAIEWL